MAPSNITVKQAKELICDICQNFYQQGWCSGSGGGVSIKVDSDTIVMAPSGVQKERMQPSDMFLLDQHGNVKQPPVVNSALDKPPKLSECAPLFMSAYELRGAGAVLHSHSLSAMLATVLDPNATEFCITEVEMIKGIEGHGFYDKCIVPIIENTARECELTDRLREAIKAYPKSNAVLVRRHGVYVWGKTWMQAKTQAECYDYLFDTAVRMRQMGIDHTRGSSAAAPDSKRPRLHEPAARAKFSHLVLDIEGTTSPLSFVTDVMFPYARKALRKHLEATWGSEETRADVEALCQQASLDVASGALKESPLPEPGQSAAAELDAVCAYVESLMSQDRKVGALKQLQGHIWREGFRSGELRGELFDDVPAALEEVSRLGVKSYIYSSGSREAQRMVFGHSVHGDLRPLLSGFFDTTSGAKVEASSYRGIQDALGVDAPGAILFATDVLAEAEAARDAGWQAALLLRPGNKPLPEGAAAFPQVRSLRELLSV